jgi:hypothetical protein
LFAIPDSETTDSQKSPFDTSEELTLAGREARGGVPKTVGKTLPRSELRRGITAALRSGLYQSDRAKIGRDIIGGIFSLGDCKLPGGHFDPTFVKQERERTRQIRAWLPFKNSTRGSNSLTNIMAPSNHTSTAHSSRTSRPRRVKQISSVDGMFAATAATTTTATTTTTPPPVQLLHAVHESSPSQSMNLIRVLRRVKRRLFLEIVADAQSDQALERGVPKTPETPVKLAPQEFQNVPLVDLMKPIRPLAARPVQNVSNGAVAMCDLEPATFQSSRAQAA